MAARVNTKFVLTLSVVLVLLVGGVAGVAAYLVMGSVESDVRQGDLYVADGDYQRAVLAYGSAVNKRPGDLALLDKWLGALREVQVNNSADARKYLGHISNALRIASETSGEPERLEAYYQQLLDWAEQLGPGFNNQLHSAAKARLDIEPDNLIARKYRGIAQVRRMTPDTSREDRAQAATDLEMVLQAHPDDEEVMFYLAQWKLAQAGQIDRPGDMPGDRPEEAKQLRADALALSEKLLAGDPDDPQRQMMRLQILLNPQFIDREADRFVYGDQARQIVDQLEARLLQDPSDRQLVLQLASMLPRVYRDRIEREGLPTTTEGMQRSVALMEAAVAARPSDIVYVSQLGQLYVRLGQTDEALVQLEKAREMGIAGRVVDTLRADQMQAMAAYASAKLLLQKAQSAPEDEAKALREQVRDRLASIEVFTGQSAIADEIRGRLLQSEGKVGEALIHIDKALEKQGGQDVDLLVLSGELRRLQNAPGAALERYEQAVALRPDLVPVRLQMARMYAQTGKRDQAAQQVAQILAMDPDNSDALSLKAALALQAGQTDEALAIFEHLPEEGRERSERAYLMTLAASGRQDEAREMARQAFDRDRTDLGAAVLLMRFVEDDDARQAILSEAEAAGAEAQRLQLLRQRMALEADAGSLSSDEVLARQMEMVEPLLASADPLTRAITEVRLYTRTGDEERAEQAMQEAIRLDGTDPRVLELRFDRALDAENWQEARQVVDAAATANADLAGGDFYRGRLLMAQGKHDEAVFALRRALDARPVYGAGWRLLGQALLAGEDFPRAVEAFQRAVSQVPGDAAALAGLAEGYMRSGQQQRALETLRSLASVRPTDQVVQQYLALEQQVGDKDRARAMRQQIAQRNPGNYNNRRALAVLQAQMGDIQSAMQTVEGLVAELGQSIENAATMAAVQRAGGQADEGRATIEQYIASRGADVTVDDYRALARYELQQGDFQAAVQAYEKALPLEDPVEKPVSRELADLLFGRRATEPAVRLYQEVLAASPNDEKVRLRLAEALMRLERYDQATQLLEDVPSERVESLVLRAMLARRQDDNNEALRLMNEAIKKEPGRADLYFQRAMVLGAIDGRERAMVEDLNSALSRDAQHTPARLMLVSRLLADGQLDRARRELATVLDYEPTNTAARLQLVNLRVRSGDITGARLLAQQGAQLSPGDPTWPPLMAQLAARQGDHAATIAAWEQAMALNPDAAALSNLVSAMLNAGQAQRALPLFREHVSLVNGQPVLQALHGRTLVAAGQGDAGRQVLSRALEAAQNPGQVLQVATQVGAAVGPAEGLSLVEAAAPAQPQLSPAFQLAMAQLEMAQGDAAAAASRLAAVEPTLTPEHPLRPQVEQVLALSLYTSGQFPQARQAYEQILARQPDDVGSLNNLAYMLAADLKDPEAALPLAERASELRPADARVLDTLGLVQLLTGRNADARTSLSRSVEIEELPANTLHLGQALLKDGLMNRARTMLERAVQLGQQQNEPDVIEQAQQELETITK